MEWNESWHPWGSCSTWSCPPHPTLLPLPFPQSQGCNPGLSLFEPIKLLLVFFFFFCLKPIWVEFLSFAMKNVDKWLSYWTRLGDRVEKAFPLGSKWHGPLKTEKLLNLVPTLGVGTELIGAEESQALESDVLESHTRALPASSPTLVQGVAIPPAQGWLWALLELTHLLLLLQGAHSLNGTWEPDISPWMRSQVEEEQGTTGNWTAMLVPETPKWSGLP